MAESAYYRCVLWSGMAVPPPSGRILSEHASFEAGWKVERGIRLQAPPFSDHEAALTDIADYRAPQELGSAMQRRGAGIRIPFGALPGARLQCRPVHARGLHRKASSQPDALAVRNHGRLRGLQAGACAGVAENLLLGAVPGGRKVAASGVSGGSHGCQRSGVAVWRPQPAGWAGLACMPPGKSGWGFRTALPCNGAARGFGENLCTNGKQLVKG